MKEEKTRDLIYFPATSTKQMLSLSTAQAELGIPAGSKESDEKSNLAWWGRGQSEGTGILPYRNLVRRLTHRFQTRICGQDLAFPHKSKRFLLSR